MDESGLSHDALQLTKFKRYTEHDPRVEASTEFRLAGDMSVVRTKDGQNFAGLDGRKYSKA